MVVCLVFIAVSVLLVFYIRRVFLAYQRDIYLFQDLRAQAQNAAVTLASLRVEEQRAEGSAELFRTDWIPWF